jgi:hypothetical protein
MRCPACQDEYEPHVRECVACGLPLLAEHQAAPPAPDTRLGTFDPLAAQAVLDLLGERSIAAETVTHDEDVEVLVERQWRDDLRAELTMTWTEVVRRLPEEQAHRVLARGGLQPGWLDPPRGGWVDRDGRTIVDVESDHDDARVVGPAMAVCGAILLIIAWYAGLGAGLVVAGLALAVVGLLLPR